MGPRRRDTKQLKILGDFNETSGVGLWRASQAQMKPGLRGHPQRLGLGSPGWAWEERERLGWMEQELADGSEAQERIIELRHCNIDIRDGSQTKSYHISRQYNQVLSGGWGQIWCSRPWPVMDVRCWSWRPASSQCATPQKGVRSGALTFHKNHCKTYRMSILHS